MIEIGRLLKQIRLAKGLSQRSVGDQIEISYVHLCNVENGHAEPSLTILKRLSAFYRMDVVACVAVLNADLNLVPVGVRSQMAALRSRWRNELKASGDRQSKQYLTRKEPFHGYRFD